MLVTSDKSLSLERERVSAMSASLRRRPRASQAAPSGTRLQNPSTALSGQSTSSGNLRPHLFVYTVILWSASGHSQLFGEPDADNDVSPETEEEEGTGDFVHAPDDPLPSPTSLQNPCRRIAL